MFNTIRTECDGKPALLRPNPAMTHPVIIFSREEGELGGRMYDVLD